MPAAKPIGTKRISHHGYIQIKVVTGERRWRFEHRWVWENVYGQIPKGAFIHHLNGIRTDNRIGNLHLVKSNAEHHHFFHKGIKKPGTSTYLKGRPKTPEHRAKISAALKKIIRTAEHQQKLVEQCKKMAETNRKS